ncbi:MAG: rod shape-determining protein MreC [Rhodospirillales bacterium]
MDDRPKPDHRIVGAVRVLAHRSAYVGLVLAAGGLMMLGKADAVLMERVRLQVSEAVAPILEVLSQPVDAVAVAMEQVQSWILVHEDNARLRHDRERLLQWQSVARHLEAENATLRQLLNFVPEADARFVTARVVADAGGAFAHSVLLSAGATAGIGKGQAVVSGDGLVGRVAGVGQRAARVLLITDLNSRIPVQVGASRTRAILAGDNSDRPKLLYLDPDAVVSPGDPVVTSGHAAAFPPGLSVGVVTSVGDGEIRVRPFVERSRLEYVRVVEYGLAGILKEPIIGGLRPATTTTPAAASGPPAAEGAVRP